MSTKTKLKEEELQQQQVAPEAATPAAPAEVEAAQPAAAPAPAAEPVATEVPATEEPLVAEDTTAEAGTFTAPEPGMIPIWIHSEDVAAATAMETGDAEAAGTAPDATVTEDQANTSPVDTAAAPVEELAPAPEPMPESKEVTEDRLTEDNDEDHDEIDNSPEEADKYAQPAAAIHSGSDSQKIKESEEEGEIEVEDIPEDEEAVEEDEAAVEAEEAEEEAPAEEVEAEDEEDMDLDSELDKVFGFEAEVNTDDKDEAIEETIDVIKDATDFLDTLIDEDSEDLVKDDEEDEEIDLDDVELPATDEEEDAEEDEVSLEDEDIDLEDDEEEMQESILHEAKESALPESLSDVLFILADEEYKTCEETLEAVVSYVKTSCAKYDLTEDEENSLDKISIDSEDYDDWYDDEDIDDIEEEDEYWEDPDLEAIPESRRAAADKMRENDASDVEYPAGYTGTEVLDEAMENDNLVRAYESSSAARRRAYSEFRKSMNSSNPRFKEALRSTSRISRGSDSEDSWNSNRFEEKYEERTQLDFAAMLKNGFLG